MPDGTHVGGQITLIFRNVPDGRMMIDDHTSGELPRRPNWN